MEPVAKSSWRQTWRSLALLILQCFGPLFALPLLLSPASVPQALIAGGIASAMFVAVVVARETARYRARMSFDPSAPPPVFSLAAPHGTTGGTESDRSREGAIALRAAGASWIVLASFFAAAMIMGNSMAIAGFVIRLSLLGILTGVLSAMFPLPGTDGSRILAGGASRFRWSYFAIVGTEIAFFGILTAEILPA